MLDKVKNQKWVKVGSNVDIVNPPIQNARMFWEISHYLLTSEKLL